MNDNHARERCEVLAEYIIENAATVRSCAKHFGMSKSTVHKDVVNKLKYYNRVLYIEVRRVLDLNKSQRHLRGGEATKQKYIKLHQKQA